VKAGIRETCDVPLVLIRFLDGEILHGDVDDLSFDRALLEADVRGADPNNERALLPLSAIRQVLIGNPEPAPADAAGWDRAAFHFIDGQVLRAQISPDSRLGRFGGVWHVVEAGVPEMRTLGVPYTALKGVFKLRQWDSRPLSARSGADSPLSQSVRILAEREASPAVIRPRRAERPRR
jgi:hypothetical protein